MTEKDSNLDQGLIRSEDSNALESFDSMGDGSSNLSHDSDSVSKLKTILGFTMHIVRLGVQVFMSIWRFKH